MCCQSVLRRSQLEQISHSQMFPLFFFSVKIMFDISFELSAQQTIHMKYQDLFSLKNENKKSKYDLMLFGWRINGMSYKSNLHRNEHMHLCSLIGPFCLLTKSLATTESSKDGKDPDQTLQMCRMFKICRFYMCMHEYTFSLDIADTRSVLLSSVRWWERSGSGALKNKIIPILCQIILPYDSCNQLPGPICSKLMMLLVNVLLKL